MKLKDITIEHTASIRMAIEKLETVRCKVVYVVEQGKLKGSVSDGDVRRFALGNGNVELKVEEIANFNPIFLNHYEKQKMDSLFENSELYSVPILNYNREIMEVVFRDGRHLRRNYHLKVPVVMMAGGKGTRLYPYTKILPKALVPIGEIPIAERIFDNYKGFGCTEMYMIVNHKKEMIQAYFDGNKKEYNLNYIEEEKPLGTGGGLYLLKGKIKGPFFLINCDVLIDADYQEIYSYHISNQNFITVIAAKYRNKVPYGVVNFNNNGNYIDVIEKPEMEYYINTGMYVVSEEILTLMDEKRIVSFPDLMDEFKRQGKQIGVYVIDESAYMDMGQLEELEKMKKKLNV